MCECFETVKKKHDAQMLSKMKNFRPETFKSEWDSQAFVMGDDTIETRHKITLTSKYRRVKNDNTDYAKETRDQANILMTYCPFCGNKFEQEAKSCG